MLADRSDRLFGVIIHAGSTAPNDCELLIETIRFTDAYRVQMVLADVQQLLDNRVHK